MTALELAAAIDIGHSSVHRHLVVLEERGLVAADSEPGHRMGRTVVTWSLVPERVEEYGRLWINYSTGGPVADVDDAG